ncbi:hypothetical protein A2U01_0105973, partial [Trifolium medium]|nr:hypothetical protein [Trifolium medium]
MTIVPESPIISEGAGGQIMREAETLLDIQKQVGFNFTLNDDMVRKNLVEEEVRDRATMR